MYNSQWRTNLPTFFNNDNPTIHIVCIHRGGGAYSKTGKSLCYFATFVQVPYSVHVRIDSVDRSIQSVIMKSLVNSALRLSYEAKGCICQLHDFVRRSYDSPPGNKYVRPLYLFAAIMMRNRLNLPLSNSIFSNQNLIYCLIKNTETVY